MALPNYDLRDKAQNRDFLGYVQGLPLQTVLQMIEIEKRSCVLYVYTETQEGRLAFEQGRVIEAEAGSLTGEAAAYEIVGWPSTDVELRALESAPGQLLDLKVSGILLDRLCRDDETRLPEPEPVLRLVELLPSDQTGEGKEELAVNSLQKVLESFREEVPEFVSTDIVNIDSGLSIGGGSIDPDFDASIAAASYAEVVKANRRALDLLGMGADATEDILISTERVYVLIRPMGQEYYHVLAVSRKGNLGLARAIMKKYGPKLLSAIGELA
ncbi:MAG TPA: DUF4388 domain-containing protein [Thermoanaerobaculia bacterium]|nr:DUF4388 domain-containing protein [Thermoanaerobaculia bacterium]